MKLTVRIGMLATLLLLALLALSPVVFAANDTDAIDVNVTVDDYITISSPADVNLANIAGPGGSSESAGTTWTVATNHASGYNLALTASTTPAMTTGANNFADYSGAGTWSIAAADSAFGFSVTNTTSYQGLNGGTPIQIRNTATPTAGENTTVYFKAQVGASHLQASGNYTASITATATTNV